MFWWKHDKINVNFERKLKYLLCKVIVNHILASFKLKIFLSCLFFFVCNETSIIVNSFKSFHFIKSRKWENISGFVAKLKTNFCFISRPSETMLALSFPNFPQFIKQNALIYRGNIVQSGPGQTLKSNLNLDQRKIFLNFNTK